MNGAANEAGAAAEVAESHKEANYADIDRCHVFEPLAVENWCFQILRLLLLHELGKKDFFQHW